MMNQKMVPLPSVLCTPKRKPCCWKMALVMERPSPVPYIFDRYYRSRSDAGKQGTGLGLSITKAIFQQHGFRFGVHSTVGKGTVFWFIMTDTEDAAAQ